MQLETGFTKSLEAPLSDDEVKDRAHVLATTIGEIAETETEQKKVQSQFSQKLKKLRLRATELARIVETHREDRPVLCSERAQIRTFTIETFRHDTGQVVDTRAMDEEEIEGSRQTGLYDALGGGGVRVGDEPKKGSLDLGSPADPNDEKHEAPKGEAKAEEQSPAIAEAEITNPGGLLDGKEAAAAAKRAKPRGMRLIKGEKNKPGADGESDG